MLQGGVGHQQDADPQRLSGLQRFLRQPQEHVPVQLLVHQQRLPAALVQADAADPQQRMLGRGLGPGPAPGPAHAARAVPAGPVQRVVELRLQRLAGQPVQQRVPGALPASQRGHVGAEPGRGQVQLRQALRQVALHAAGRLDLPDVPEGVQADAGQLVLRLEVIPVASGDVEEDLDGGTGGEDAGLDDEGAHLPAERQLSRDVQGTAGLQQLLGQGPVPGKGSQADVDGGDVFGLEDHEALGALQQVSPTGPRLGLLQEEGQLGVGHLEGGGKVDAGGGRGTGPDRGAEGGVGAGGGDVGRQSCEGEREEEKEKKEKKKDQFQQPGGVVGGGQFQPISSFFSTLLAQMNKTETSVTETTKLQRQMDRWTEPQYR